MIFLNASAARHLASVGSRCGADLWAKVGMFICMCTVRVVVAVLQCRPAAADFAAFAV